MKEIVKYSLALVVLVVDGVGSFYAGEFRQQSFDVVIEKTLLDSLHRIERACTKTPELPAKTQAEPTDSAVASAPCGVK